MGLEQDIHQEKFASEAIKANINLAFTTSWISLQAVEILKPFGISIPQFNVLRILRGRAPEPASVKYITERMIDKMSNASRLVDKLQAKGFVERVTCPEDRRRVHVTITELGLKQIAAASVEVEGKAEEIFSRLGAKKAKLLNELLDELRT